MVDSKENYKFDVGVKVLGYKHLSSYSSFQSVGFWGGGVEPRKSVSQLIINAGFNYCI